MIRSHLHDIFMIPCLDDELSDEFSWYDDYEGPGRSLLALGGVGPFTFGLDAKGRDFDQFWIR